LKAKKMQTWRKACVSVKYRFAFIHVPKAAGKSVLCSLPDVDIGQHYTIQELRKWGLPDDFRSFAFCRNPYDRLLSVYCWRRLKGVKAEHPIHGPFFSHHAKLSVKDGFEKWMCDEFKPELVDVWREVPSKSDYDMRLFAHQHCFTHIDGVQSVNRVYVFESVIDSFKEACHFLDIGPHLLQWRNMVAHPAWPVAVTQAAKDAVYAIYSEDFRLFEYDPEHVFVRPSAASSEIVQVLGRRIGPDA